MAHLCIRLRSYLLNLKGGAEHYFPNIFNRGLIYTGRGFQKIEPFTKVLLKTIRAKNIYNNNNVKMTGVCLNCIVQLNPSPVTVTIKKAGF